MTGTAQTEAAELMNTYGLNVVPIPTNREMVRVDEADLIYKSEEAKFKAVVDDIAARHETGQPVLVGTVSVEKSELLSRKLQQRGVKHEVLNAKQHTREASIVAQAGRIGSVTVATNMAGRGVDILLGGNPEGMARAQVLKEGHHPDTLLDEFALPVALEEMPILQNGVDNIERLRAVLRQEIAPAAVYVATEMAGPGHVRHHGRGELVIGATTRELAPAFTAAGVPVQISDNVMGALWEKLVLNCAYNALSAISQLPYGRMVQGEGVEAVMRDVVAECLAVARGAGVILPEGIWESVQRIARTMPTQLSSTAQDLARGKRSEIDHLNGYIVSKGAALGIATPANRVLHSLVKLLEGKRA